MLFARMISLRPIASGQSNIGPCSAFRLHDFVLILVSYVDLISFSLFSRPAILGLQSASILGCSPG